MEQLHYRPDHGKEHSGKYAAYVRVSTDKQDVKNQEHAIKDYLNGGDHDVKWFRDKGVSSSLDWDKREALQLCLDYCRKEKATMIVYSISRMARRTWETLKFLEQEIKPGKIKLVVVDNPNLDHKTVGLLAAVAEMERNTIRERTQASLNRIKAEIAEKGYHISKSGVKITSLGSKDLTKAQHKGANKNKEKADARAKELGPFIANLHRNGATYREIAANMNKMGIPTPTGAIWYGSSVRNYHLRAIWAAGVVKRVRVRKKTTAELMQEAQDMMADIEALDELNEPEEKQ